LTTALSHFSASQIAALSSDQMAVLSLAQIAAMGIAGTSHMTATQVAALTATQINNFNSAQLSALTTTQMGELSGAAVSGLSNTTLARLSSAQTAALLASQANNLSVAQISVFSATQLSTTTLVGAAGGLRFNLSWDSSVGSAPAGFRNAAIAAAAGLAATFSNNVVVNIQMGYGEVGGNPISAGAAAQSGTYLNGYNYTTVYAALQNDSNNSSIQATADASLSTSDPTSGGSFAVSRAQQKALGLSGASSALDGFVGLSKAIPFEFNQTATTGKFDAIGALQHEFTEVMGRTGSVGAAFGNNVYTTLDLYRYTSTNNADPSQGTPIRALSQQSGNTQYFSINGGTTNLGGYNPSTGSADYADWNITMGGDPFGFAQSGITQAMTGNGMIEMAAIGWNLTSRGVTMAQAAAAYALV
jgi:hypothetical protein